VQPEQERQREWRNEDEGDAFHWFWRAARVLRIRLAA
jgi:hypothetical protein